MLITVLSYVGVGVVIIIAGFFIGFFYRKIVVDNKINSAENNAKRILDDAKKEAETLKKEAIIAGKEEVSNLKLSSEQEVKSQRQELQKIENRLLSREESLDKKSFYLEKKEQSITSKEKEINDLKSRLDETLKKEILRLEAIAELTRDEAKAILKKKMEDDAKLDSAKEIKAIETKTKEESEKIAKKIISQAIQRCAIEHTSETTVSVVNLPNDEMKGRIIGREGRNIRVFENLTGINIIVDDTPEAVILSSFDPVRREIARVTLDNLIMDGRIHPARIEEMYEKAGNP